MSKWKNQVLFQSTKADHDHGSESKVSQRYWFYYSFRIHGQERSVAIGRKEIGVTHPKDGTKVGSRANSEALILLMAPVMLFLLSAISPSFSWGHLFIVEVSCSSHHPFKKVGQELAYAYLGANVCFGEKGVSHSIFQPWAKAWSMVSSGNIHRSPPHLLYHWCPYRSPFTPEVSATCLVIWPLLQWCSCTSLSSFLILSLASPSSEPISPSHLP